MKEKTIEWIRQYVEDKDFPRIKLDKAIEALSFYSELDNTFENSLNDMNASIQVLNALNAISENPIVKPFLISQ